MPAAVILSSPPYLQACLKTRVLTVISLIMFDTYHKREALIIFASLSHTLVGVLSMLRKPLNGTVPHE